MADTPPPTADTPARTGLVLRAQYIKDLSFENPRAPGSLFGLREPPQMEIAVNLGAARLEETVFELAIHFNTRAIADSATLFLCDLVYAGVFELHNIPEEQYEPALFIGGAQLLFPFARRVLSDVTRDGGFPPVALEPMDFAHLYATQRAPAVASA